MLNLMLIISQSFQLLCIRFCTLLRHVDLMRNILRKVYIT